MNNNNLQTKYLFASIFLIIIDQLLKFWAHQTLSYQAEPIPAIPFLLEWQLTYNTGAAWSMLSGFALPLAILRMIFGFYILYLLISKKIEKYFSGNNKRWQFLALLLVASGAIGNAIDGVFLGKVVDMIHMPLLSIITNSLNAGSFPIFNLADSYIVLGSFLLIIVGLGSKN